MKTIKFDETFELGFSRESYANGNLAIQCWVVEDGVFTERYETITTNLDEKLSENCAYLDTNNVSRELLSEIISRGWAIELFRFGYSGYYRYPMVEFTKEFLERVVS